MVSYWSARVGCWTGTTTSVRPATVAGPLVEGEHDVRLHAPACSVARLARSRSGSYELGRRSARPSTSRTSCLRPRVRLDQLVGRPARVELDAVARRRRRRPSRASAVQSTWPVRARCGSRRTPGRSPATRRSRRRGVADHLHADRLEALLVDPAGGGREQLAGPARCGAPPGAPAPPARRCRRAAARARARGLPGTAAGRRIGLRHPGDASFAGQSPREVLPQGIVPPRRVVRADRPRGPRSACPARTRSRRTTRFGDPTRAPSPRLACRQRLPGGSVRSGNVCDDDHLTYGLRCPYSSAVSKTSCAYRRTSL